MSSEEKSTDPVKQPDVIERLLRATRSINVKIDKQQKTIIYSVIAVVAVSGYFQYSTYSYIKENNQAITKKIDDSMNMYTISKKNEEALTGFPCAQCHISMGMYLPKTSGLTFEAFSGYVRGTDRFAKNTMMPKFTDKEISDDDLMRIWKKLY